MSTKPNSALPQWSMLSANKDVSFAVGMALVLAVLFRWPPLMMELVPKRVKHWRAANLARRTFLDQGLHHTRGGHGVLIFVSEAEHYVEILADQGIARHVDDSEWQTIVDAFIARVKARRVAEGFQECVAASGEKLATHVPDPESKHDHPTPLNVP